MTQHKGLGRGLDALLGRRTMRRSRRREDDARACRSHASAPGAYQPRTRMDDALAGRARAIRSAPAA